ncbi:MAG: AAA family ATPase, partial [Lachnospiraceae bacterium]|nr:AAA family ATPase [Lachnospiraceae bacterium]
MKIMIGESEDSFRKLRENGFYYVDKTLLLKEYLTENFKSAVLFARPRRFGKTLTMTMFRDFLDIRQESGEIFAGLEIMEHTDVVRKYMNQYPVVFLSLKEVFGDSFEDIVQNLRIAVSKMCEENIELLDSPNVSAAGKKFFEKLLYQEAKLPNTQQSLDLLSQMLRKHYGKQVFVIVDEYDVPIAKALDKPYYDKVRDMVEHMLSYVCKTNDNVKAVMLSGCLYTVKNSTYTGVNNIIPYTVLTSAYASSIGFTDGEVRKLLFDAGFPERYDTVREWYDGYIFGRDRMYCPWDVLRYVGSVLDESYDENQGPESYWVNSSETAVNLIRGFLGKIVGANEAFEQLLAGQTIDCTVNDSVPYHRIHESGENLWSALVETGYLTKAVEGRFPLMPLRIPNRSTQIVFRQEVWEYFKDKVDNVV